MTSESLDQTYKRLVAESRGAPPAPPAPPSSPPGPSWSDLESLRAEIRSIAARPQPQPQPQHQYYPQPPPTGGDIFGQMKGMAEFIMAMKGMFPQTNIGDVLQQIRDLREASGELSQGVEPEHRDPIEGIAEQMLGQYMDSRRADKAQPVNAQAQAQNAQEGGKMATEEMSDEELHAFAEQLQADEDFKEQWHRLKRMPRSVVVKLATRTQPVTKGEAERLYDLLMRPGGMNDEQKKD